MNTYLSPKLTTKEIQELLCVNGIGVVINGKPNAATTRAVKLFQEICGLEIDGIVGPKTTDFLTRRIKVCAELAETSAGTDSFTYNLCRLARAHLNLHPREIGGDNRGPWVRLFSDGSQGGAWCAWWATFVVVQAWDLTRRMGGSPTFARSRYRAAWCPSIQARAAKDGRLISMADATANPLLVKAGMLFLVWSPVKNRVSHVGIVVGGGQADGTFETIEGNTNDDGNFNGVEVARRIRTVDTCYFVNLGAI